MYNLYCVTNNNAWWPATVLKNRRIYTVIERVVAVVLARPRSQIYFLWSCTCTPSHVILRVSISEIIHEYIRIYLSSFITYLEKSLLVAQGQYKYWYGVLRTSQPAMGVWSWVWSLESGVCGVWGRSGEHWALRALSTSRSEIGLKSWVLHRRNHYSGRNNLLQEYLVKPYNPAARVLQWIVFRSLYSAEIPAAEMI